MLSPYYLGIEKGLLKNKEQLEKTSNCSFILYFPYISYVFILFVFPHNPQVTKTLLSTS